ncbi:hypothetical protein [Streptococcus catagoni]|nr:hypothetical protein [Streptococcus catagoni]
MKVAKSNTTKVRKTNKVNKAEVFQLILLLIPAVKLAKKILRDRKMK